MKMMKLLALVSLLAGCASTPPPRLPEANYTTVAKALVTTDRCVQQGDMDVALGAYGKTRIHQDLAGYWYSASLLQQTMGVAKAQPGPPQALCRQMAMAFAGLRDEYERNSRDSQNTGTQYTNCYSGPIGTNCISY